jgi:hypothetical protein
MEKETILGESEEGYVIVIKNAYVLTKISY